MTARELMQLVAGRSPAATRGALHALRAIEAESPIVSKRVARVATDALADASVGWSPSERESLAEAAAQARVDSRTHRDDPAIGLLSGLIDASGLSIVEFAGVLGRDERGVRRYLSGELPVPDSLHHTLARVRRIEVTRDSITVTLVRN